MNWTVLQNQTRNNKFSATLSN